MTRLPIDGIAHSRPPASPLVEATLALVQRTVRRNFATFERAGGTDFSEFVRSNAACPVTKDDMHAVEQEILRAGHRFEWSAAISLAERPEAYHGGTDGGADFMFTHPDAIVDAATGPGRAQCGQGDNVVQGPANIIGTARYIRSSDRVLAYLTDGVPEGTIAMIDDSGGTLTAPIIEQFAGILCAGGSVRSHLGILAREFGIPCFMNSKLSGIRDGDLVEMEATAVPRTTEDYQTGTERSGRVWRLEAGQ